MLMALRRRQAHARDTVALERRVPARTRVLLRIDEDDEAGEMAWSAENLAIISSALTPYKGGLMLGSSEIVGALGRSWLQGRRLVIQERCGSIRQGDESSAACSLLSPDATGQLRRKYTRWILQVFTANQPPSPQTLPQPFYMRSAPVWRVMGVSGAGKRSWLCRDLVGILSGEQDWARLPLSASGKFLRAQARLFPGNSCGQEVDALVRKVARVTVEKLRHEDESVCDFWAAGNIVAGLAPC